MCPCAQCTDTLLWIFPVFRRHYYLPPWGCSTCLEVFLTCKCCRPARGQWEGKRMREKLLSIPNRLGDICSHSWDTWSNLVKDIGSREAANCDTDTHTNPSPTNQPGSGWWLTLGSLLFYFSFPPLSHNCLCGRFVRYGPYSVWQHSLSSFSFYCLPQSLLAKSTSTKGNLIGSADPFKSSHLGLWLVYNWTSQGPHRNCQRCGVGWDKTWQVPNCPSAGDQWKLPP
jgi:hypothetical protein